MFIEGRFKNAVPLKSGYSIVMTTSDGDITITVGAVNMLIIYKGITKEPLPTDFTVVNKNLKGKAIKITVG